MSSSMSIRVHLIMLAGAIVAATTAQGHARPHVPSPAPHDPRAGKPASLEDLPPGLRQAVSAAFERDAYRIQPAAGQDRTATYEAVNRINDLRFRFRSDGVEAAPRATGEPAWRLRMTLVGLGYEGEMRPVDASAEAVRMHVEGNRVEYHHRIERAGREAGQAPVVEWYVNDRRGLEQGFTLAAPPERSAGVSSPLRLNFALAGNLTPAPTAGGSAVRFFDDRGAVALRYGHLHVFDATGRELSAHLASAPGTLSIVVDDRQAVYPLTIDPLLETEVKLTASDAAGHDYFGCSVSISGDTAVVGAYGNDDAGSDSGAAYIFQRHQGGVDNWGEVTKLTASGAVPGDYFGHSVSISGDTTIVGAPFRDTGGPNSGLAYIFQRDEGGADNWGEVTYLLSSDASGYDYLGYSVSISGDTAIVGAHGNSDAGSESGSAYIFQRDQGGADNWGQMNKLAASGPAANDKFGYSVSISGDTAIVGAPFRDTGGPDSGLAYIFRRDQGGANNWGEVTYLLPSDASGYDYLGYSVSISGDTTIVGAHGNSDAGSESGSAYIFRRDLGGADNWGQVTKLTASDAAGGDLFGQCVSINRDTAIVGARHNDDTGAAYIFHRGQGGANNWGEVTKLTASDAAASDWFGYSVSIDGNTVVAGAHGNSDAGPESGSAYVLFHGLVYNVTQDTYHVSIQAAIDNANDYDVIEAEPGTYYEAINLLGLAITLRSTDGAEVTTIDATGLGAPVVTCVNGEDSDSILEGFTITGGTGFPYSGDTFGGGMFNNFGASPTVTDCIFGDNNTATYGAGMYNGNEASPTVTGCTFSGNTADAGGGMLNQNSSNPTVTNCTFSGNTAALSGGGVSNYGDSHPTVINCTFSGNAAAQSGGGIDNRDASSPTVTNCTFSRNWGWYGGGINNWDPESGATVANSIFWGNEDNVESTVEAAQIAGPGLEIDYSCVQGWTGILGGVGNTGANPVLIDPDGLDDVAGTADDNLRLSGGSPAINAGTNSPPGGLPATDLDGNPRIVAGIVDLGAYESLEVVHNANQDTYHATIQAAIDSANDYDVIEALPGTYYEAINLLGLAITLRSTDGAELITIDATGLGAPVVTCVNGEGPDTILEGFTITGGTGFPYSGDTFGGGMFNNGASPTVTDCIFGDNNTATYGAGMCNGNEASPTVTHCTFIGNTADYNGGGMLNQNFCNPTVTNCTFSGNSAQWGGGVFNNTESNPTVTNCTFSGNTAAMFGGSMYNYSSSNPTVTNCMLWGNGNGEIHNEGSTPTVTYSDVQGGTGQPWFGIGCLDVDPLFVDADGPDNVAGTADDNVRLSAGSLCINAGDPAFVPPPGETDRDGHARVLCDLVDMGAYEFGIGDYDCSQVVDLTDFGSWTDCLTGPNAEPYSDGCEAFDFDYDGDVDLQDFSGFCQVCSP